MILPILLATLFTTQTDPNIPQQDRYVITGNYSLQVSLWHWHDQTSSLEGKNRSSFPPPQCSATCTDPPTFLSILFYHLKHSRRSPLSIPIRFSKRSHLVLLLLISGIHPNPGPRPPKYPCGVCSRAVKNIGQRALACDDCDRWCHMACLEMNTPEFDNLASSDLPWFCPSCSSRNRSSVIYDIPEASDHSSMNLSGIISSNYSTTMPSSCSTPGPSGDSNSQDTSNSTFSSIGSPTNASSPKISRHPKQKRNSKALRFLCVNFQSARRKGRHISTLIDTVQPDIIMGTETWLSNDVLSSEIFDEALGFEVHRNDRPDDPHGGVLLAVKKDLNITDIKCSSNVEFISGTIKTKTNKKMVTGTYYRPPSRTDDAYLVNTRQEFMNLKERNKNAIMVLGGDFNLPDISWDNNSISSSKHYPNRVNQHYLDLASDLDLEQMVSFPTRLDNTLDLIFTTHPSFNQRCKPLPPIAEKSDHDIVLFDMGTQPARAKQNRRTVYLWKKANEDGIKAELREYGKSFMDTTFSTIDDMWINIKSTIDQVITKHVPTRRTLSKASHPWVNTRLRRLTRRKMRAYRKARSKGCQTNWARYHDLKAKVQREMRSAHKNYVEEVSTDFKENPKRFWSYIKSKKQESSGIAPLKNKEGFIHSDSSIKAEILNNQFKSVFTQEDISSMPDLGPSPHPTMDEITVGCNGVRKQLNRLSPHKATGPDQIPTAILKLAADELAPILSRLYQWSLDLGEVPQDWRDALVVPVFKKGEKHLPSNYRPVSLTSVVCKVLEHIIHSSVMKFFDQQCILTDNQHGFRSKRSCETQLLWTIQDIASKLQGKGQVDVILLDFSKAFDKVPHKRLLYKLQHYGVRGNTIRWISSFLQNRKQQVLIEGTKSTEADVTSGVPQGSVLGPLLFLAYINDLPERVTNSDTRLFADDSLLFRFIQDQQDADLLQKDLSALEKWERDWQMQFHPEKCTVIRICPNKRRLIQTTYCIHDHVLQVTDSSKYLGVTLSEDLSWKKHIDEKTAKANRTLGFIRRNLGDASKQVKSAAYTAMVRPTLEYASTVWDPANSSDIHKLEQVQRKAARFVHRQYTDRTPGCVTQMVQDLGWASLQLRRYQARLSMLFKISHNLVDLNPAVLQANDVRTRGFRFFQIPATTNIYRNSFFPRTIKEWNRLPINITGSGSIEEFRSSLVGLALPSNQ